MNKLILTATALLLVVAYAPAEDKKEKIENPEYAGWAKQKEGAAVTYKMTMSAGGMDFSSTITNKLLEVGKDKVVIETETTVSFGGKDNKQPATKKDVPKEVEAGKLAGMTKEGKPEGTTEEGKEKVKVGGTEYDCKWYKFKSKQKTPAGEEEVEGQIWMSDDVPGKLVKMTSKMKLGTMNMEATEITTKK